MQGWNLFYPHILALRVWHYSCACIAYFIFLSATQTLHAQSTTCWKLAFILPLCPTTTVGGRGRVC